MPNENVLERRWQLGFESRAEDDGGRKVEGYAAVYGQRTEIGNWFTEEIREGAFSASVDRGDDVVFLIEHWDLPLARSTSGTLKLEFRPSRLAHGYQDGRGRSRCTENRTQDGTGRPRQDECRLLCSEG